MINEEIMTSTKWNYLTSEEIKRVCLKYVTEHGYVKGSYGYHNNNGTTYRGSPTVSEITSLLANNMEDLEPYMCSIPEYREMNLWVDSLKLYEQGEFEDYYRKCVDVWGKDRLDKSDLSLICAFCNSFNKDKQYKARQVQKQEREREHAEKVASDSNVWVGEIGQEIEFSVASANIVSYVTPKSYYAVSYPLWKIVDTEGHQYSWGDTKDEAQIKPGDTIKGKVKAHNEFKRIKETRLTRIKIKSGISNNWWLE